MIDSQKDNSILVVDDAPNTLELLQRNLSSKGYRVIASSNVTDAIKILENENIDIVITDYKMPKIDGLDLIRHIHENYKDIEVIMITGYATVEGAVEAIKTGAEEYLAKPFTDEELFNSVERALDKLAMRRAEKEEELETVTFSGLIGKSEAMQRVFKMIKKAAATSVTTLIHGESGTGKELVARAIHYYSLRASAPFVPVNCGGIPEGLLESELFGYVKGAFTGANMTRAGFFQTADGGTIFLDEISEASLAMQVKMLRVLQSKEVCMVGDTKTQRVDVRILAATNKDLNKLVEQDSFREDLLFRLNVINIEVPPLRERQDDILLLTNHFTEKFAKEQKIAKPAYADDVLNALKSYSWPGNVRELENTVQRLIVMTEGNIIRVPDLPSHMRFSISRTGDLNRTLEEVEAEYIKNVLFSQKGNKSKAAQILGIDRKTLREKLKKYQIE